MQLPIRALLVLGLVLSTSTAQAQAVAITHEGAPGVWLPVADFRLALDARNERDTLRPQLHLTTEALTLCESETVTLRTAITEGGAARALLQQAVEAARAELAEAAERIASAEGSGWWPGAISGALVGLLVGAGVVLGAVFGAR